MADVTLYDFQALYRLTPEVMDVSDEFSYHEKGKLHLKVDDINISAFDFPVKIRENDWSNSLTDAVKNAFSSLFENFLASDKPIDENQTSFIDTVINESFISY